MAQRNVPLARSKSLAWNAISRGSASCTDEGRASITVFLARVKEQVKQVNFRYES
jgi:hypothetical protein